MKPSLWFIPLAGLLLTACAGGGGGGGGSLATTPTPTPTPTYTYSTLAGLTANTSFTTGSALYYTAGVNQSVNGVVTDTLVQTAAGATVMLSYNPANQTYTISGTPAGSTSPVTQTFGPADLQAGTTSSYVNAGTNNGFSFVTALTNRVTGVATSYSYTALGTWGTASTLNGLPAMNSFDVAFGNMTQAGDLPRTGSASYALQLTGVSHGDNLSVGGTGSITANFAAGTVNVSLSPYLSGGGAQYNVNGAPFTTLTGTGNIASASSTFSAAVTGPGSGSNPTYTGGVNGGFYGPQGAEVGGAFYLPSLLITGGFLGKKQ